MGWRMEFTIMVKASLHRREALSHTASAVRMLQVGRKCVGPGYLTSRAVLHGSLSLARLYLTQLFKTASPSEDKLFKHVNL